MNLSSMKEIKIGNIPLMELYIGGMLVWKKLAYTNLIPLATTEPGGSEIYNGTGYMDGARWSSSGGAISFSDKNARLTGWIPFVSGETYRLKNLNIKTSGYVTYGYFVGYCKDGSIICKTLKNLDYYQYNEEGDIWTFIYRNTEVTHFRISAYSGDNKPIITVNEEII